MGIGIYLLFFQGNGGELELQITGKVEQQLAGAFGGKIKIAVNEQFLDEASVVEARLINNSGKKAFTDDRETVDVFTRKGKIIDYEVISKEPEDLNMEIQQIDDNTLRFSGFIFGDKEQITFRILIDSADPEIGVTGRILVDGPKLIKLQPPKQESGQISLWLKIYLIVMPIAALAIVPFFRRYIRVLLSPGSG